MKHHKRFAVIAAVIAMVTGMVLVSGVNAQEQNDASGVTMVAVTIDEAAATALQAVPGTISSIKFSDDDDIAVWEIEVVNNLNHTYDLEIDAGDGTIIKKEIDHNDYEGDRDDDEGDHDREENDKG